MENKTPTTIEGKLDMILNYYRVNAPSDWNLKRSDKVIKELTLVGISIIIDNKNTGIYQFLVDKLVDDGFIKPINITEYQITFKGYFFDGYSRSKANKERIENRQLILEKATLLLSIGTCLGALAAALYYGLEVYKMFHPIYHCH